MTYGPFAAGARSAITTAFENRQAKILWAHSQHLRFIDAEMVKAQQLAVELEDRNLEETIPWVLAEQPHLLRTFEGRRKLIGLAQQEDADYDELHSILAEFVGETVQVRGQVRRAFGELGVEFEPGVQMDVVCLPFADVEDDLGRKILGYQLPTRPINFSWPDDPASRESSKNLRHLRARLDCDGLRRITDEALRGMAPTLLPPVEDPALRYAMVTVLPTSLRAVSDISISVRQLACTRAQIDLIGILLDEGRVSLEHAGFRSEREALNRAQLVAQQIDEAVTDGHLDRQLQSLVLDGFQPGAERCIYSSSLSFGLN